MGDRGPICYGQSVAWDWAQETYETASQDAGRRARELRGAGFRVVSSALGSQVTGVGLVKLTMLTVMDLDGRDLPPVKVERL